MKVLLETRTFLCVIFVAVVGLCCVQYLKYTSFRPPILFKPINPPPTNPSTLINPLPTNPSTINPLPTNPSTINPLPTNPSTLIILPPIKLSTHEQVAWKSHFIYQAPKNLKLVSLTYNCPNCGLPCLNVSKGISETCKGMACLCNTLSPVITFPTYKDNSARSNDFMLEAEKESLHTPHVTDLKALPSITKTQVMLLRSNYTHKIGDKIRIIVTLVNGYGKKLLRGGDDIRVSMTENRLHNSMAGTVYDYKNGSYLITIPVLWEGTNTIAISMNYFQEEKAAIFRWYRQFGTLFYHYGRFKSQKTDQYTLCAANPHIEGYKDICNMSLYNDGDPWFCGKPSSNKLECNDIVQSFDYKFIDLPVTEAEKVLFRRKCTDQDRNLPRIQVKTIGGDYKRDDLPHCNRLNPAETWKIDEPNGYFLNGIYYSTKCRWGSSRPNITHCVQNTRLILHGDSTVLQWIKELRQISGCILNKNYTGGKWYEEMVCSKKDWRFTLQFAPHTMPFSCFRNKEHKVAPVTKSIETVLNEIPSTGRTIFVFHFGAHFTRQHYNVFRHIIIRLKSALKKALGRNKNLTIMIKGPHMYTCVSWVPSVHDALLPNLITILIDELKTEFSDRVFYLNYYDMSVAAKNKQMHAGPAFIRNMLETMLSYTCK